MGSKLLVITLLTFSGLVCPLHFAEALRCYQCGDNGVCNGSNQKEVECPGANGCLVSKDPEELQKACGLRDERFDCLQKELGQSGDCIEGSESEMRAAFDKCGIPASRRSYGKLDFLSALHVMVNSTGDRQGSVGQIRQSGAYAACICTGNLCNTDDLVGAGSGATGQIVEAVTMVASGLLVLMMCRLF